VRGLHHLYLNTKPTAYSSSIFSTFGYHCRVVHPSLQALKLLICELGHVTSLFVSPVSWVSIITCLTQQESIEGL